MIGIYKNDKFLEVVYDSNNIQPDTFYGDVLYVGMGGGYLFKRHTNKVNSTTFIEYDQDIIDECNFTECMVINGDAYNVEVPGKFDIIVLNIWDVATDLTNVETLIKKFEDNLKIGGKIKYLDTIIKRVKGKKV